MKVTRRTWIWSVVLVALLASCDRHPLTEEVPYIPEQDGMVQGMTPQGPEAGPLSTESPRILAPSGMAPVLNRSAALPPGLPPQREAGPQPFAIQPFAAPAAAATTPRIVWENTASGQRSLWFMNGPNWDSGVGLPEVDPTWQIAGSGDFNGDAHPDLVWQHLPTGHRVIWYMNDATFTGQFADLGVVDPIWHISAVADFNNDGHPDLLWTHLTEGHRVIWFMNGPNYTGQHAFLPQVDLSWQIAGAADFNGDTHPDILWQHLPTGQRVIWLMNGAVYEGQFVALPTVDPSWHIAGIADFNGDAKPDLVWTHLPTGWRAIWLMNGTVWENVGTLLPVVPSEWRITGTLDPPGPPGPPGDCPGALTNGENHHCAITIAAQLQNWTFTANQGDFIALSIAREEPHSDNFHPWIRLLSPTGQVLASGNGLEVAQINQTAPANGTFTVIVGSRHPVSTGNITGTGNYRLLLAKVPGAFVVPPGDQGGLLTNGQHHPGFLLPGDLDMWTFTANQGDYIALSIAREEPFSTNFHPWIRLLSPTGQVLAGTSGTEIAQINQTVSTSGTYTVIVGTRHPVSTGNISGTGNYRLLLAKVPGAFVVPPEDQGGPLTNGDSHPGFIHLGDLDMWTFSADQGDFIALSLAREEPHSANFHPWIRLLSPTGQVLDNRSGIEATQINRTAPVTGTYTMIIGSRHPVSTGNITGTGNYLLYYSRVGGSSAQLDQRRGRGIEPVLVHAGGGDSWTTVSIGSAHTCGSAASPAAYCWSRSTYGQLGNGTTTTTNYPTPTRVLDPQ